MTKNLITVAKREYLKTVRKPAFWLATLALPLLIGVLIFISGLSSMSVESKFTDLAEKTSDIILVDKSGVINTQLLPPTYLISDDLDDGLSKIKSGEYTALIHYSEDVLTSGQIQIHHQSQGIFVDAVFDQLARSLITQSIQLEINDPAKVQFLNSEISVTATIYDNGEVVPSEFTKLIVPAIAVGIYFVMVFLSSNFMLMSVSEEKENRMVETVLTAVTPRDLILGKIVGYVGVALTQLAVFAGLAIVGFTVLNPQLPFEITLPAVTFVQIISSIFYIMVGFLMLSSIMVGVGSAMPNYRDAQNFSAVFVMLSILPVYFISILIAEPSGTVAMITSYFPLTAPVILLFRNALGEISGLELLISSVILIGYLAIAMRTAFKLFEFGGLEYSQKISFTRFWKSITK